MLKDWPAEEYAKKKEAAFGGYVKPIAVKDLEKVWKHSPETFGAKNTLIVDDSVEKIPQPENHLWIPTFEPQKEEDDELQQLQAYLQQLLQNEFEDVREYMRLKPFKPGNGSLAELENKLKEKEIK